MIFKKSLARKISAVFFAAAVSVSRIFAVPSSTVESDTAALMTALFKDPSGISNVEINIPGRPNVPNASIGTFEDGKDLVGLDKGIVMGTGDVSKIFNSSSGSAVALLSFEGDAVEATAVENVTEVTSSQGAGTSEGVNAQNGSTSQGILQLPTTDVDHYYYPIVILSFDIVPKSEIVDFQCVLASDAWEEVRTSDAWEGIQNEGMSVGRAIPGKFEQLLNDPDVALQFGEHIDISSPLKIHVDWVQLGLKSIMKNAGYYGTDDPLETNEKFISMADEYKKKLVSYTGRSTVLTQSVEGLKKDEVNHIEIALMVTDAYWGNTYFFIGYNDDDDLIYSQDKIQNKFSDGDDNTGVTGNGKGDNNTENSSDNDSDEDNKEPESPKNPNPSLNNPKNLKLKNPNLRNQL